MPATYEPIATTTLGSDQTTITFNSISSAFTDLRLVATFTWTQAATDGVIRINNDSTNIYSQTVLRGNGSAASSDRETASAARTGIRIMQGTGGTTSPTLLTADFLNYRGSTYKTCLVTTSNNANGSGEVLRHVGLVQTTSAITRLDIVKTFNTGVFAAGSTFTLYGILKA